MCVCDFHLSLRDELSDLLACIKWSHFNMSHPPICPLGSFQNLIMLLENLPESCEVQVLTGSEKRNSESVKLTNRRSVDKGDT